MTSHILALLALVPLMTGAPAHESGGDTMIVALCNGGEITIDLGRDKDRPEPDCHQKGCHAGACRERQKSKPTRAI